MVSVSKGEPFACAVTAPGAVVSCWGSVEGGVLGKPVSTRRSPVRIVLRGAGGADSIIAVTAGATPFACALNASGAAQCWGANDYGEIGDGTAGNVRSPTRVRASLPLASISAGENMACGLTRDGRALCWGLNEDGQLGVGDSAVHHLPVPVRTRFRFRQLSVGAAGGTCGVLLDAHLLCWGRNDGGQLGTADDKSVFTPRVPTMVAAQRFSAVNVGNGITCGLTTDARVLCWGSPGKYLGSNAPSIVSVVELGVPREEHVVSVVSGFQVSCLLTQSRRVYCWGSNEFGGLGRRGATSTDFALGRVASDADYIALNVGAFGCAVTVDGALDCWGSERRGRAQRAPGEAANSPVERISFE
jgi:alpha-tubulin suppressor-like RCC1 family protein